MYRKGFSLVELLIGIVIGAILVLTIGVLSSVSLGSYNRFSKESEVYNDIYYGFKLIQNRIHANKVSIVTNPGAPWKSDKIVITGTTERFGLYQPTGSNSIELIRFPDATETLNNREIIFSIPINSQWANPTLTVTPSGNTFAINLQGTKDNLPFNLSTTILMRNP